jgi:hypothetical protein
MQRMFTRALVRHPDLPAAAVPGHLVSAGGGRTGPILPAEYVPKTACVTVMGEVNGSSRHRLQDGCSAN